MRPDADPNRETEKSFTVLLYSWLPGEHTACHTATLEEPGLLVSQQERGELWANGFIVIFAGKIKKDEAG